MNRQTFAVVVKRGHRLSVAGSVECVAQLLKDHAPSAILPGDWPAGQAETWLATGCGNPVSDLLPHNSLREGH